MASESNRGVLLHPVMMWSGWLIGPGAWALHLLGSYLLVSRACESGSMWLLHGATLFTLLLSLAGAAVAWRQWGRAGRRWPASGDGEAGRVRFMAVMGLLLSALSALLIVAEAIPNFFLSPCL
ncbi:hypothetical protein HNO52_17085 [Billgrantia diversa]|uniref:hypothetical protein n=1 Tax=Halomonas sp. MCCC 1A13316 TaxID=2733487 RepID=UPI0018A54BF0|nr:hypothetical protein [Halomonas sp. MCCC 1A13316]QOR40039.1 hypothetical protein HNO52_17085 [Halomonas sp. MCCC 1A13316]